MRHIINYANSSYFLLKTTSLQFNMAHPSLVESLFIRKRPHNLSISSTNKDSNDSIFPEDDLIKVRFNIIAKTPFGCDIRLVGNIKELGLWNTKDSLLLKTSSDVYPL